jgi:hypothetical protein
MPRGKWALLDTHDSSLSHAEVPEVEAIEEQLQVKGLNRDRRECYEE